MQRMGPLLCLWIGGIRRAEQARLRWSLAPPRGERARDCAARSASRPPPVRRIPPSPPRRSKLCIACSGFFHFIPKSRSALTPLLLLSAKGSAWLACSLASALTTARRRCQPFAGPVRAHALHGPSALLLDRWDSKGGTENAAVRHFPAPGASPRPGGAPSRWSPVPVEPRPGGASPRPGENGRGNRSGQRADAPRERRGERQRLALKHPFHPLQIRSASRVTSFQASPANRRGSRPPRSPR